MFDLQIFEICRMILKNYVKTHVILEFKLAIFACQHVPCLRY